MTNAAHALMGGTMGMVELEIRMDSARLPERRGHLRRLRPLALAAALAGALLGAGPAQAHRQWMLPSATVLSGEDAWVTVDAAVSNDLFYFEHMPLRLDGVKVYAPDGSEVALENAATGHFRSTFDVHLTQQGTYRIVSAMTGVMGSYTLNGETKRLPRGTTRDRLAAVLPAGASDLRLSEMSSRNELFVTLGAPTTGLFKPGGVGLEMIPVTHPDDLYAGEAATFRFLLDGKPAVGVPVTVIPGGSRYRDKSGAMDFTTDAEGKVTITWPAAGMYWLNASLGGERGPEGEPGVPEGAGVGAPPPPPRPMNRPASGADGAAPGGPEGAMPPRRASYMTTLEVLAP